MRHPSLLAAIAPVLLVVTACGGKSTSSESSPAAAPQVPEAKSSVARTPEAEVDPNALAGVVTANNVFAMNLLARVASSAPTSNVLVAPLSASMALTMAYAGAKGETASQMATALQLTSLTSASTFSGQNALGELLSWEAPDALGHDVQAASENGDPAPNPDDYQLQIVNSMWGEQSYTWAPAFLDTLASNYGAGVYEQDFIHDADSSRQTINTWVGASTSNEISNLLPQGSITGDTRIVLVNAIHLKLPWQTPFVPSATANAPFTRSDGSTVTVPFMNSTGWLPYIDEGSTGARLVYLPLAGTLELVIALPYGDIGAYEAALGAGTTTISTPYSQQQIALSVPKVSFTSGSFSLKTPLQAMGMTDAFTDSADFSGMCTSTPDGGHIQLSDVVQKTTLSMEENGVEAAAATAVIGAVESASGELPTPFVIDHPFVVTLLDTSTNAVLFVGHVQDPSSTGSP